MCNWPSGVDNMASPWSKGEPSDSRITSKRNRSAMSRGDEKVVEIDTLRAFTIPKMKKAKHGVLQLADLTVPSWENPDNFCKLCNACVSS